MGKKALATAAAHAAEVFGVPAENQIDRKRTLTGRSDRFFSLPPVLIDRSWCEKEPFYVQFIPYVTLHRLNALTKEKELFAYTRGGSSGEERLKDKISVGVGGHVETLPNQPAEDLRAVLFDAALREIEEEIGSAAVTQDLKEQIEIGLDTATIYLDTRTETESVHLGVFISVYADFDTWTAEDNVVTQSGWQSLSELEAKLGDETVSVEPWSRVVIQEKINLQRKINRKQAELVN